jgi:hypothetical protein
MNKLQTILTYINELCVVRAGSLNKIVGCNLCILRTIHTLNSVKTALVSTRNAFLPQREDFHIVKAFDKTDVIEIGAPAK